MSYHAIEERLLSYDEIEPTPSRPSFSTRAFELLDDACKLAFGILCVESLGYLGYLYFTGAEADPLLSSSQCSRTCFACPGCCWWRWAE